MRTYKQSQKSRKLVAAAILSAACFGAVAPAKAANYNWTGGGGSLNTGWNAPANWFAGNVPANFDDAQIHFLNGGVGNVQNIASPMYVNAIEFGTAVSTTIGGNPLGFELSAFGGIPAPTIAIDSNLPNTINNNLVVYSMKFLGSGTGTLSLTGNISGAATILATQPGVVRFSGNNTFSGGVNISSGTIELAANNTLPANSVVVVESGGALNIGSFGNGSSSVANKPLNKLTVNGGLVRVPNSNGDFWLNSMDFTGGNVDMTGSNNFWTHFTGIKPEFNVNVSNQTVNIGGGSFCQLRNNSADDVLMNVKAGTAASGIDLELATGLTAVAGSGAFRFAGGGTIRLSGKDSNAKFVLDAGTVRFDDPSALTTGGIDLAGGVLQYGGVGSIATTAKPKIYGGWINVKNAQATANFTNGLAGGSLHKTGPGTLGASNLDLALLDLKEGTVRVMPDGSPAGTSTIDNIHMPQGSRLDLTNNDQIADWYAFSTMTELHGYVKTGYANGAWTGGGITSSAAAASPGHALGIAESSDIFQSFPATFSGKSVDDSAVLIKYTYYGDTDLNGIVNFDDYARTDTGFNTGGTSWFHGDFNYDGMVNFDDYALIDLAFNTQNGTLRPAMSYLIGGGQSGGDMNNPALQMVEAHFARFGDAYANAFVAAVPEPTTTAIFGVAAFAMIGKRLRRKC